MSTQQSNHRSSDLLNIMRVHPPEKQSRRMSDFVGDGVLSFHQECEVYCEHLNNILCKQDELSKYLPLNPSNLLLNMRDGVLLTYILNYFYPELVVATEIRFGINMDKVENNQTAIFEATANLNRALNGAKSAKGLVIVNIGAEDFVEMNGDLVLGLLWQLIRNYLLEEVNLVSHPELIRLLEPGENLLDLASLRPEPLLLRWFNYHLGKFQTSKKVTGFSKDLIDGEAYLYLLSAISPYKVDLETILSDTSEKSVERIVTIAKELGCKVHIKPSDITSGHPRLNLAFVAMLFNMHPGIHLPSDYEIRHLYDQIGSLQRRVLELEGELGDKNYDFSKELSKIQSEKLEMDCRLQNVTSSFEKEIFDLKCEFNGYKTELAEQYQESLNSVLENERRTHSERISNLQSIIAKVRKHALSRVERLSSICGNSALWEIPDLHSLELSLENLLLKEDNLVNVIESKFHDSENEISELRMELDHKMHLEEIMTQKIKQYSEAMISTKTERNETSTSTFKQRILPAIRRALTCQGH